MSFYQLGCFSVLLIYMFPYTPGYAPFNNTAQYEHGPMFRLYTDERAINIC